WWRIPQSLTHRELLTGKALQVLFATAARHDYSISSITFRSDSRQWGISMPNVRLSFPQSRTELRGRWAAVGYSSLLIGTRVGAVAPERLRKISDANSNQVVSPAEVA